MSKHLVSFLTFIVLAVGCHTASADTDESATLYERLGGMDGIQSIVRDTIALHHENPSIQSFFEGVDDDKLAKHVAAFFAAGTGGPANYEGRDMASAHANMGLSDADFDSAVADVLKACKKNGVGDTEIGEVAAILESLRPAVMAQAAASQE